MSVEKFNALATANDVALLLGSTYASLAKAFYKTSEQFRYRTFEIKKKGGGMRKIYAPNRKVKKIQRRLAQLLADAYEPRPSVHGFVNGRSIVSNAERHQNKRLIFNIDLSNFFESLHFGRIRNLFAAKPFEIPQAPATVLAHICCFKNILPQGAPTSPILTNIICRKLDRQLQALAKHHHATYSRYADDITFSFSCSRQKLPAAIVDLSNDAVAPGAGLIDIINQNGFQINPAKTRLRARSQRQEVTGLTVNKFANVKREFVRRTSSMLYAWEKFGLQNAASEFASKYSHVLRQRASTSVPNFAEVVKGRLAFLHMVRGRRDPIYVKLAKRFNKVVEAGGDKLPYTEASSQERALYDAMYVVQVLYDGPDGLHSSQGSGFSLSPVGFVTAAHVVSDNGVVHEKIEAHTHGNPFNSLRVVVLHIDHHRDIAICTLLEKDGSTHVP